MLVATKNEWIMMAQLLNKIVAIRTMANAAKPTNVMSAGKVLGIWTTRPPACLDRWSDRIFSRLGRPENNNVEPCRWHGDTEPADLSAWEHVSICVSMHTNVCICERAYTCTQNRNKNIPFYKTDISFKNGRDRQLKGTWPQRHCQ